MTEEFVWFSGGRGTDHAWEAHPAVPVVYSAADGTEWPVATCGQRGARPFGPPGGRRCSVCAAAVTRKESGSRRCYKCRQVKPFAEFGPAGLRRGFCRSCGQADNSRSRRERLDRRRAAATAAAGGPRSSGAPPSVNTAQRVAPTGVGGDTAEPVR